jgi:phosphopantothenoylcysteine decarboxylase/phosphopantothenate--cysteine ligase
MARSFVTPLTLGTLSKRPVLDSLVQNEEEGVWNNHVELGLWADLFVIAPASANTLARMAHGEADNLLLTTYLSARSPVFFAPAMDLDMHAHPSNQANIATLIERGNIEIPAQEGELASGLEGKGRMAEPEHIVAFLEAYLRERSPLAGKKVMITAGPTYEPIDPVRFIGNRSSGKMGYSIAREARNRGAEVVLISGPVSFEVPEGIELIKVETADEMYEASARVFPEVDLAIFAAAVADYRPVLAAPEKIKKDESNMQIDLIRNPDILGTLGPRKTHQFVVGFALETGNELDHAREKRQKKNCDLMVLNSLRDAGAGFGHDTNQVTLITGNKTEKTELRSKEEIAGLIFDFIQENGL